jgi:signal transduction histidine kinase
MTSILSAGQARIYFLPALLLAGIFLALAAFADPPPAADSMPTVLTNIAQVRQAAAGQAAAIYPVRLSGTVLWVGTARDQLIFQDDSGGALVKIKLSGQSPIQSGDGVLLAGDCLVSPGGEISAALVDNDGIHSSIERSGTTFLSAGWHPITLEWFNGYGDFGLSVDCQGPGMPRQPVPAALLFCDRPNPDHVTLPPVRGLNYRCYEGQWDSLPDFSQLPVVKEGVTTNFNIQIRTRDPGVGLVFSGFFRTRLAGNYTFWCKSDDGSRLSIGNPLRLVRLPKKEMPAPLEFVPGRFTSKELEFRWVEVEGIVTRVREVYQSVNVELTFGAEPIYLKVPGQDYDALAKLLHDRIRATGIYQNAYGSDGQIMPSILVPDPGNIAITEKDPTRWADFPFSQNTNGRPAALPMLTKAIQVKSLSRNEAERGYPVKIQGVITARVDNNFVIQDSTWSIFCYGDQWEGQNFPQVGEMWEITGASDIHFAPDIMVRRATYLGPGIWPEPIRPTKEELVNGSLDTQYIEVRGIATDIESNGLTLLTREGKLRFYGLDPAGLDQFQDALIRIRGVCIPERDTNQMILTALSPIRLFNASINVDEAAPTNLFDLPLKHVSDLLRFDAHADALRRVKLSGQISYVGPDQCFFTDGVTGARFELKEPTKLEAGDLVQVVGFPDVSGPSPVLHEALVRVSAKASLPEARFWSGDNRLNSKLDATLVSLKSRLIGLNTSRSGETLELQAGTRSYLAQLAARDGTLPDILPGSLLRLTGVYAAEGNSGSAADDVPAFELLLNSPAEVQVLERPSWWTVRHTLIVVGGMLLVIVGALVWITLLHRQVEERTRQLASEIKGREQAESHRALEAERTRIAQDLHDELGATLTEIRFLGAVKSREPSEDLRSHLQEVSEKSNQMVSSLDEIVWAVNPANDSLPNLANYLCHLAEDFFRTAEMRCRLDVDEFLPPTALTSEVRHSLYLVVREALNNVAKHSQATEAWLRIHCADSKLSIVIEDNGRGFAGPGDSPSGNGLPNMRSRLQKIGGTFACTSRPGSGTICRIDLPLT